MIMAMCHEPCVTRVVCHEPCMTTAVCHEPCMNTAMCREPAPTCLDGHVDGLPPALVHGAKPALAQALTHV